jgi:hypothetical protein
MVGLITVLVFIGILLVIVIALLIASIIVKEWKSVIFASIIMIMFIAIEIIILKMKNVQSEPTALDVYRGLTELEITSVNGVQKDTIVVFKNR